MDLNADLGEGMDDAAILPFLTSANVACGLHAGGPLIMDRTVALALERGVRVGAHPSYADRENFGRTAQQLPREEVCALVLYQVAALDGIVRARGGSLAHVKAHGALYNQAARDLDLACAIADAVRAFRRGLHLVGLAGSAQIEAARAAGLRAVGEAFADRRYLPDGSLMPRSQAGAVLDDPDEAAGQALSIASEGFAVASDGSRVRIDAQTLCLHGDTPGAVLIARAVRQRLEQAGVEIAPL
ncbi:MAG TPA: 5-oxoprolinase subunit PxpA [Myxococcales bacterium]|nr:5-oxoprolinase subunit PxpA [Myxococcales bacterium]